MEGSGCVFDFFSTDSIRTTHHQGGEPMFINGSAASIQLNPPEMDMKSVNVEDLMARVHPKKKNGPKRPNGPNVGEKPTGENQC